MRVRAELAAVVLAMAAGVPAVAAPAPPLDPAAACVRAAAAAERRWGLPAHLLEAIGEVESGRRDRASGSRLPWPWSINVAGTGYVFGGAAEAGAVVGLFRSHGVASIDVGCFQVNLHYHPGAFATVATTLPSALRAALGLPPFSPGQQRRVSFLRNSPLQ
jgi:hypothetical protein